DRVLTEGGQVDGGAQRAADEAADFMRTAADAALDRLAVAARVGGARQHRVLRGYPAQPAALAPARHALRHAGRAQHAGVAAVDHRRALGPALPAADNRDVTELVRGTPVGSAHGPDFIGSATRRRARPGTLLQCTQA